ncbi:MAG: glycosyltransferase family 4 protein [Actinobacteria bacterium]|nr:glycosyltransferase family 4 protein [Actinomycetota bacterium]
MQELRIIYCDRNFPPLVGGSAIYYEYLCSRFPANRLTVVTGLYPGSSEFDENVDYRIVRVPLPENSRRFPGSGILWLYQDNRALFSGVRQSWNRAAAIVVQIGPMGNSQYLVLLCRRHLKCPVIIHVGPEDLAPRKRGPLEHLLWRLQWMTFRHADHLVPFSSLAEQLLLAGGIPAEKVTRMPPAVDLGPFLAASGSGQAVRQRYGIGDSPLVLSVGRLVRVKGHDLMIRAWPQVMKEFPDARYVIIGRGPLAEELRGMIGSLGIQDRVSILESVQGDELPGWYDACDLFVNANRFVPEAGCMEGFGGVFVEAAAAAKPVIGGKSGGTADAVCDGVNGYLIDVEDGSTLVEHLLRMLSNQEHARGMGLAGLRWVSETFDARATAIRNMELCDRVYSSWLAANSTA